MLRTCMSRPSVEVDPARLHLPKRAKNRVLARHPEQWRTLPGQPRLQPIDTRVRPWKGRIASGYPWDACKSRAT